MHLTAANDMSTEKDITKAVENDITKVVENDKITKAVENDIVKATENDIAKAAENDIAKAAEQDIANITEGEPFIYVWRITNLGELEDASAVFYKTITISSDISIEIKVKRSPLRISHLPDYLHEGKIRIRDASIEAMLLCKSSTYIMSKCTVTLCSVVEDFSDGNVVINNVFGGSIEETTETDFTASYQHTDIMTYDVENPNDMLEMVCELQIIFSSNDINAHSNPNLNFEHLFENPKYSDFVFVVDGQEFHVHKAIVALWSPIFEAVFNNNTTEKKDLLEIKGVDPNVFKEVLRFMYTGKIENFYEFALELLKIANKYKIKGLKTVCEQRMCVHLLDLPVEDVVILLACVDLYKCEWLKTRVINQMISQGNSVIDTHAWKTLILSNPLLMNEIRDAMTLAKVPVKF
ncbi:uncharacterized protein LOC135836788 [Planococcus citri]|uniref:uncharacterized protein LOC135836788 n=1 Tax=Planococcus citri TaxID=170843 RepID=UPI0031FA0680